MYLGQVVELTSAEELFAKPLHPYTQALLSAIPVPKIGAKKERIILKGEISSPIDPPDQCRFAKRCLYATDECRAKCPRLRRAIRWPAGASDPRMMTQRPRLCYNTGGGVLRGLSRSELCNRAGALWYDRHSRQVAVYFAAVADKVFA